MKYDEQFAEHYRDWFKGMGAKNLINYERNLSAVIDSDLFNGFLLADEVLSAYELIRDECVDRVSKIAELDSTPSLD